MKAVLAPCLLLVLSAGASTVAGAPSERHLYRYTDADGVVHLVTSLPPAAAAGGYQVLDRRTLKVIRAVPPAASAEERAARRVQEREEAQERAAREAAAASVRAAAEEKAQAQARRDRALLHSYTTVEELEDARQRQLDALDSIATGAQATVERLETNLGRMHEQRAQYEKDGRAVPQPLQHNIADVEGKLERQRKLLTSNAQRRADLAARFERDIARYRELTTTADPGPPPVTTP